MSWQKCPICEGTGYMGSFLKRKCVTCQGKLIINAETGHPPKDIVKTDKEMSDELRLMLGMPERKEVPLEDVPQKSKDPTPEEITNMLLIKARNQKSEP